MAHPVLKSTPSRRIAQALRRACEEHGIPNTFAPSELENYGAPRATVQGKIGRGPGRVWLGALSGLVAHYDAASRRWVVRGCLAATDPLNAAVSK